MGTATSFSTSTVAGTATFCAVIEAISLPAIKAGVSLSTVKEIITLNRRLNWKAP